MLIDLPCSSVSSWASSSPFCSTRSAKRSRIRSRSAGVRPAQLRETNARQADITARSTSAVLASAVVAIALPVAGSQTVRRFSLCAACCAPSINRPCWRSKNCCTLGSSATCAEDISSPYSSRLVISVYGGSGEVAFVSVTFACAAVTDAAIKQIALAEVCRR